MLKEFIIKTSKSQEVIDINRQVEDLVSKMGVENGICVVYVPHATAGILINENYDEKVREDISDYLEKLIPSKADYKHDCIDNNGHAHVKAAIIGPSETIIIKQGKLLLGTWQSLALAEFDGPRERKVYVAVMGENSS